MRKISFNDIPSGETTEDVNKRRHIIAEFYYHWKRQNPTRCRFNQSLKENIFVRFISITETCTHAARSFRSTVAVLHLDEILTKAVKICEVPVKNNRNQKEFEKMLVFHYVLQNIGTVKMTVGVKRRTHERIQYCITALDTI